MGILIFGDSYVAAADRGRPGYARIAPLLMLRRGSHMGLGGTGFVKTSGDRPAYAARLAALMNHGTDAVIVQASGNDAPCDLEQVRAAAQDFLTVAAGKSPQLVVVGPMWAIEGRDNLPALRDTIAGVCAGLGIPFIDGLGWLSPRWIGPDGAHPTWGGHAVIAWKLAAAYKALRLDVVGVDERLDDRGDSGVPGIAGV